jgi:hypothetical protein
MARGSSAWCYSVPALAAMPARISDYDVAVFLRDMNDRMDEMNRLADRSTAILDETGGFVHAMPYSAGSYNDQRMPLMHEIRADGIDL